MKNKLKSPIFSFFRFYYYAITKNKLRYYEARTHPNSFYILVVPVILFVLYMLFSMIFIPAILPLAFLWIPIIVGNLIYSNSVSNKWYENKRRKREEEEDERKRAIYEEEVRKYKEQNERIRKHKEEAEERLWKERFRMYEEEAERLRRQRNERINKGYRDWYGDWEDDYEHSGNRQQTYQKPVDNNMKNAIKLLGLSEGFVEKDVKSAYRRLSKIHHPDVGGLQVNFIKLTTAYEYLMARI